MTQVQLDRQVARANGEDVREISRRGFSPLTFGPLEREPEEMIVDWDELQLSRNVALVEQPESELAVA